MTTKNKKLLIIVDYQNDFVSQKGLAEKRFALNLDANRKILPNIQKIIKKWRKSDDPILFIMTDYNIKNYQGEYKKHRTHNALGNTAIRGTWGHQLYKINTEKKDKIILKHFPNAYLKTDLEKYLKNLNPSKIYFGGVNTDVCLFHTAFQTALLGYKTYVIENATATPNKKNKKIFLENLNKIAGVEIIKL